MSVRTTMLYHALILEFPTFTYHKISIVVERRGKKEAEYSALHKISTSYSAEKFTRFQSLTGCIIYKSAVREAC